MKAETIGNLSYVSKCLKTTFLLSVNEFCLMWQHFRSDLLLNPDS